MRLLSRLLLAAVLPLCASSNLFDDAARLLFDLQHPTAAECAAAKWHVLRSGGAHPSGYASGVHTVVAAMSAAVLDGRLFNVKNKGSCGASRHSVDAACAAADLFRPLTNCTIKSGADVTYSDGGERFKLTPLKLKAQDASKKNFPRLGARLEARLTPRLRSQPALFWAAVAAAFVTRPRKCLAEYADRLERAVCRGGNASRAIAVHARSSEKAVEALTHDAGEYAAATTAFVTQLGYKRIIISSDVQAVAGEIRRRLVLKTPGLDVGVASGRSDGATCGDATIVAAEVLLLARADRVVGTLSSNVGRLVYELQFARVMRAAPDAGDAPLPSPRFFDVDGLAAPWTTGDGDVDNNIKGFWYHLALQNSLRCVFASIHSHRPQCQPASKQLPPGLYDSAGKCFAGCSPIDALGEAPAKRMTNHRPAAGVKAKAGPAQAKAATARRRR